MGDSLKICVDGSEPMNHNDKCRSSESMDLKRSFKGVRLLTKNKRCVVTIDNDTLEALKKIKKEQYFDKAHSELYRDLFRLSIAPVVGAFAGSAMDAVTDAVLGPFDVAIDYAGRALMPGDPEASPVRAAIAEKIQRYNPAGMLRDYAKEQSAPMLADVPQRQYDPNAGYWITY